MKPRAPLAVNVRPYPQGAYDWEETGWKRLAMA
jgi:hypothetical protein